MQLPPLHTQPPPPQLLQLLASLAMLLQVAEPPEGSQLSSVHGLLSSQLTPVQLSTQAPPAEQMPVLPAQAVPVLGAVEQVVAGGASQVFVVHSLPSSQDPSGSACALQSDETQVPAPSHAAGAGALVQRVPFGSGSFTQTAGPDESSQLSAVQSLPSSQLPGGNA
jgi:hypothetical protein